MVKFQTLIYQATFFNSEVTHPGNKTVVLCCASKFFHSSFAPNMVEALSSYLNDKEFFAIAPKMHSGGAQIVSRSNFQNRERKVSYDMKVMTKLLQRLMTFLYLELPSKTNNTVFCQTLQFCPVLDFDFFHDGKLLEQHIKSYILDFDNQSSSKPYFSRSVRSFKSNLPVPFKDLNLCDGRFPNLESLTLNWPTSGPKQTRGLAKDWIPEIRSMQKFVGSFSSLRRVEILCLFEPGDLFMNLAKSAASSLEVLKLRRFDQIDLHFDFVEHAPKLKNLKELELEAYFYHKPENDSDFGKGIAKLLAQGLCELSLSHFTLDTEFFRSIHSTLKEDGFVASGGLPLNSLTLSSVKLDDNAFVNLFCEPLTQLRSLKFSSVQSLVSRSFSSQLPSSSTPLTHLHFSDMKTSQYNGEQNKPLDLSHLSNLQHLAIYQTAESRLEETAINQIKGTMTSLGESRAPLTSLVFSSNISGCFPVALGNGGGALQNLQTISLRSEWIGRPDSFVPIFDEMGTLLSKLTNLKRLELIRTFPLVSDNHFLENLLSNIHEWQNDLIELDFSQIHYDVLAPSKFLFDSFRKCFAKDDGLVAQLLRREEKKNKRFSIFLPKLCPLSYGNSMRDTIRIFMDDCDSERYFEELVFSSKDFITTPADAPSATTSTPDDLFCGLRPNDIRAYERKYYVKNGLRLPICDEKHFMFGYKSGEEKEDERTLAPPNVSVARPVRSTKKAPATSSSSGTAKKKAPVAAAASTTSSKRPMAKTVSSRKL